MIPPLQAIIGYGTKATIYCPSTLQLFNTHSCSLLLLLPGNSTCPLVAPSSYSQLPLLLPLSMSLETPLLLLSFYLESEASGKQALSPTLSITFNHPHVYSALRLFHCSPASPSPSLCPAQLPLHAYYGSAFNHSIACQSPFNFYLSLSNCFLPHHLASV